MKNLLPLLIFLFTISSSVKSQIYVKHDATGSNDGTSWENAYTDLESAIASASNGDEIWVAAGTYKPSGQTPQTSHFSINTPIELFGGFAGTESNLNERDIENNITIISGDLNGDDITGDFTQNRTDNAFHVVWIKALDGQSRFDGFQVSGGMTRTDNIDVSQDVLQWRGGGMLIQSDGMIANCTFTDNLAYQGAGLLSTMDNPIGRAINIKNCNFNNNNSGSSGAGAYFRNTENVYVTHCLFEENEALSGAGMQMGNINCLVDSCIFRNNLSNSTGGAANLFYNQFTVLEEVVFDFQNTSFENNETGIGGGAINVVNLQKGATYRIENCNLSQNRAVNGNSGNGSAIRFSNNTSPSTTRLELIGSSFTGNQSDDAGAVNIVAGYDTITTLVDNCYFASNSSGWGPAISLENNTIVSNITAYIYNSSFETNTAGLEGGAISFLNFNQPRQFSYTIDSCSFTENNSGDYAGAISSIAGFGQGMYGEITNSSFLNNTATNFGGALYSFGEYINISKCLFEGNNATAGTNSEHGGGAIYLESPYTSNISQSMYKSNTSGMEGGAIYLQGFDTLTLESVAFIENEGNSSLRATGPFRLLNSTFHNNENGIKTVDDCSAMVQNTIFQNNGPNLIVDGKGTAITSNGSNISSDGTLSIYLLGNGSFMDLHDVDPLLDEQSIPEEGSPCVDQGNPTNVVALFDAVGNDRIQGAQIDIGALESPFSTSIKDVEWDSPDLKVFPNPVSNRFNVEVINAQRGEVKVMIYNTLGQLVFDDSFENQQEKINYSGSIYRQPAGSYFLLVNFANKSLGKRIVITD